MGAFAAKLTRDRFRAAYAGRKPSFELLNGEAVQKALGTNQHGTLQVVLAMLLRELGFKVRTELTLAIGDDWEPIPDVCAILNTRDIDPYPTAPVAVTIEVLSPGDPFPRVVEKARRYSNWGVADILVFDPVAREAWRWDRGADSFALVPAAYSFASAQAVLALAEVWRRFDAEL